MLLQIQPRTIHKINKKKNWFQVHLMSKRGKLTKRRRHPIKIKRINVNDTQLTHTIIYNSMERITGVWRPGTTPHTCYYKCKRGEKRTMYHLQNTNTNNKTKNNSNYQGWPCPIYWRERPVNSLWEAALRRQQFWRGP